MGKRVYFFFFKHNDYPTLHFCLKETNFVWLASLFCFYFLRKRKFQSPRLNLCIIILKIKWVWVIITKGILKY